MRRAVILSEGLEHLFVAREVLSPGARASSPHFHTHREEIVYVLRGAPTLVLGDALRTLSAGEHVTFVPGVAAPHYLRNDSPDDVEYLVIAHRHARDEVRYSSKPQP